MNEKNYPDLSVFVGECIGALRGITVLEREEVIGWDLEKKLGQEVDSDIVSVHNSFIPVIKAYNQMITQTKGKGNSIVVTNINAYNNTATLNYNVYKK